MRKGFPPSFFVFLLFLTSPVLSQEAKITGRVTDSQGGVLPGATVVATQVETGLERTVSTNAAGIYVFPSVARGRYRLQVSLDGFRSYVHQGLVLLTGQTLSIDVAMELAGLAEAITVTGESPMISTTESKIGGVVENIQIENVPINTRDTQHLALLVPGAKPANQFDPTKTRVPAIALGTNGTGRGVLYTLDGGDNSDDLVGGIVQQVSMDSVEEFEVITSRMKAEYGRASGGVIRMITKSGTNQFKGSLFEFFRDRSLNARTQPEKDAGAEKGPFQRHQLGATFGGPLARDKAFFFAAYERVHEDVNSVLGVAPEVEALYDPSFIEEHGGFGIVEQPFRRDYLTLKYRHQLSPANRLDVRLALEDNQRGGDQVGAGFGTTNVTRDYTATQTNDLWNIQARFQTLPGPSVLNEIVFQVSEFTNAIVSDLQPDFVTPGPPTLYFPSLTVGQNDLAPQKSFQRKYELREDFSYNLDAHGLKFGGSILRVDPMGFHSPFFSNGWFEYDEDGAALDSAFLFGQLSFVPQIELPLTDYGVYFQDDWRVNESLTLNLGIRYDIEIGTLSGIEYGRAGNILIHDPRSPYFDQGMPKDDKNNVAPRLGFVWDVGNGGQTVIRGGWGLFYDKLIGNTTGLTAVDASGVFVVIVEDPPFGPHNVPPFDELLADFGFPELSDNIIPPGFEFPRTSQATIGLSHQITPNLALDADFVHSKNTKIGKKSDVNERTAPFDNRSRLFWPEVRGRLLVIDPVGESQYDGLQVSLRKRFSRGTQFIANYTWSRYFGNARGGFQDTAECRACVGDERDVGPLPNDTTHRVVLSGVFQLPGEFQVSALFQGESGRPLDAKTLQDTDGNGRRDEFTNGPHGEPPGRGNFRGDPTYTLDVRLARFFHLGGERSLQLMVEAFNLFNRVNWGRNIEEFVESPIFGKPQGALWTNQLQLQIGARFTF